MEEVSVGMTGLMIDGVLAGKSFKVEQVEGDTLVVMTDEGDCWRYHYIPRTQFHAYDPHEPITESCPYQLADTVFIHHHRRVGATALVTGVSEGYRRLVMHLDGQTIVESFDSVTLVSPTRRDILPDYLAAIERVHPLTGYSLREDSWWADQRLRGGSWDEDDTLLALAGEFERFQRELKAEQEAELLRKKREFTEAYGPLSHEERVERWRREFSRWVGWETACSRLLAELARRYFTSEELQRIEEDAVQAGHYHFPLIADEPHVPEPELRTHAVEQEVFVRINEGYELKLGLERARRRIPLRPRYQSWRAKVLPDEETLAQTRQRARDRVMASADALRARIRESHGLLLPDQIFDFWACWQGLYPSEQKAMSFLGIEPIGLFDFFHGPDASPPLKGLDPRLRHRAYRDPPEFFPVVRVSETQRFGLWCEDLSLPPRYLGLVDEHSTKMRGFRVTLLEVVRKRIEGYMKELESLDPSDEDWMWLQYSLARDALVAATPATPAQGQPPGLRFPTEDGMGVLLRMEGAMDERAMEKSLQQYLPHDPEELEPFVEAALAHCAAGDASKALVFGRSLHWESAQRPEREEAAARLLEAAYRATGQPGLAELVVLHHRHRRNLAGRLPRLTVKA